MPQFALFDLDNTLVDSLPLKALRDQGRWTETYRQIPNVVVFDGVTSTWRELRRLGLYLAVVTHSPRPYAERLLKHARLAPDALVAYHDLQGRRKPQPYGYEQACEGRRASCGIAIGDERNDLLAADAFGCMGVFAGWSRNPVLSTDECRRAGWSYAAQPDELIALVATLPRA